MTHQLSSSILLDMHFNFAFDTSFSIPTLIITTHPFNTPLKVFDYPPLAVMKMH